MMNKFVEEVEGYLIHNQLHRPRPHCLKVRTVIELGKLEQANHLC
jgi:hypothetical protein